MLLGSSPVESVFVRVIVVDMGDGFKIILRFGPFQSVVLLTDALSPDWVTVADFLVALHRFHPPWGPPVCAGGGHTAACNFIWQELVKVSATRPVDRNSRDQPKSGTSRFPGSGTWRTVEASLASGWFKSWHQSTQDEWMENRSN